jgi:EF hand
MSKFLTAIVVTLAAATGLAIAQTAPPPSPSQSPSTAPPAATAPGGPAGAAAAMDPAVDAKFKAADKDGSGSLEGVELEPFKAQMTRIDADKDGKISRAEYAAAARAGLIR